MKPFSHALLFLFIPCALCADAPGKEPAIQVAIFDGDGVGPSFQQLVDSYPKYKEATFHVIRITTEQILAGKLAEADVLVHPGGSGSKQGKALGEEGRKAVRRFVSEGGGYLGVCAGAYLATNDYTWSLNLIDAKVVDRRHWARGKGDVQIQLSPKGAELFESEENELTVHYAQGPLLGRREWDDPEVPDYESLAIFATEIALKGAPKGIMPGTSAAIRSDFGNGRVFCFSPHPELTEGLHHLIPLVTRWVAGDD